MDGQKDDYSLHYVIHIMVRNLRGLFSITSLTDRASWPDMCPSGQNTDGTSTDITYEIAGVWPCTTPKPSGDL